MRRVLLALVLPCFLLTGCSSTPSAEDQKAALEAHVLAVHDEAMSKMSQLYRLRRDLTSLRDTLVAQQADSATMQLLQQQLEFLGQADATMMDWMHQYRAPDSLALPQAMEYLETEQKKINHVNAIMDSAITAARQTYTAYEHK